jgi:lysyl-tRNA synthetase class 2
MTTPQTPAAPESHTSEPVVDTNKLVAERREKLAAIRAQGVAFPNDFKPTDRAAPLHAAHGATEPEPLEAQNVQASVGGRLMLKRVMGKACFGTIQDATGRIQVYVTLDAVGAETLQAFKHWDLGDILGAEGTLFKTKTGELSIKVTSIRLLTKSLRPLPDKFHGMTDQEQKYRQRYVDLIMDEQSRARFLARSTALAAIRQFMVDNQFLEVETPMMHPIPGGANAKPFTTHHNALDQEMFLRIAPELYLKRLVVGGFERVFEINRNFRNEGVSVRHNPEFTMMEFYAAWWNHRDLMDFTEEVLRHADVLHAKLKQLGEEPPARWSLAELQFGLFEAAVEEQLWQPTFIIDYPVEVSPLARASDADPSITERFELFITGREYGNGFSELNDPEEQAARFAAQANAKDAGDEEAMYFDADYIRALEYGLPPTGGCGIGIDRLVMLLTDAPNIRDVILFPALRKEA